MTHGNGSIILPYSLGSLGAQLEKYESLKKSRQDGFITSISALIGQEPGFFFQNAAANAPCVVHNIICRVKVTRAPDVGRSNKG